MEETIFDRIQEVDLQKIMETSYIDYAMSVIASRALPDVRDGEQRSRQAAQKMCPYRRRYDG